MYTKQAMHELGMSDTLTSAQQKDLDEQGYFVVEDLISPVECRAMAREFERLHEFERLTGGHEVHVEPGARRVSNIFNKSNAFDQCLELQPVLATAHHLLGEIKVHGANLRDPVQGHGHQ